MERTESPIDAARRLLAQSRLDLLGLLDVLEKPVDEQPADDTPIAGPDSPIDNARRLLAESRSELLAMLADERPAD